MAGIPTLPIDQSTTRIITVKKLRDAHQQLLDPTAWTIHGVARMESVLGPMVGEWVNGTPTGAQGLAEVVDADPLIDPTVLAGEKWIYLHVKPSMSAPWTWTSAELWVQITEPSPGNRQESFPARLTLNRTTVY